MNVLIKVFLPVVGLYVCAEVMVYANQRGWLRAPAMCVVLAIGFTGLIALVIQIPDLIKLIALVLFTGLLLWLGHQQPAYTPTPVIDYVSEQPSVEGSR